jgi:hypothetical protein
MHLAAVVTLCALVGYFAWRDLVELFVAWYSGSEPPMTGTMAWGWCRIAVAIAAVTTAIATLKRGRRQPRLNEARYEGEPRRAPEEKTSALDSRKPLHTDDAMDDPHHPILDKAREYAIGAMHYHVGLDGGESYIDLDLHRGGVVRRLRFSSPQQLEIEVGFPVPTGGMVILDVRRRGLEGLGVWVSDVECSHGAITFWARDVLDRDAQDAR